MIGTPYARALTRYVVSAATVLLLVTGASVAVVWWAAKTEAEQVAEGTAQLFAGMVASPLRVSELSEGAEAATETRQALDRIVGELLSRGEVYRVKIWVLEGEDRARVLYSDLQHLEGSSVAVSPPLRRAVEERSAVVLPVPKDLAHASEFREEVETLEVYLPFEDAEGAPAVAELYFFPKIGERMRSLLSHTLPVAVGAPLLLSLLTFPLVLRLARSAAEAERGRLRLAEHALAASEDERRRLARLLHDGPIQDLATVGFRLERSTAESVEHLGGEAAEEVRAQVRRLRLLLDDLDPLPGSGAGLHESLRAVVDGMPEAVAEVEIGGDDLAAVCEPDRVFVLRCSTELLRNALRHSGAERIAVSFSERRGTLAVEVADDGVGFDPSAESPSGHHGLSLVSAAVEQRGGSMEVSSGAGGTVVGFSLPGSTDAAATR